MQPQKINLELLKQYQPSHPHLKMQNTFVPRNTMYPLEQKNIGKTVLDTPSTSHGITRINQKINSIAQQPLQPSEQTPQRQAIRQPIVSYKKSETSNILSLNQIKQNQAKIHQRSMSKGSVKSDSRKLYVSISKSNRQKSQYRSEQVNMSPNPSFLSNDKQKQRIRLARYMQFRSNQKIRDK